MLLLQSFVLLLFCLSLSIATAEDVSESGEQPGESLQDDGLIVDNIACPDLVRREKKKKNFKGQAILKGKAFFPRVCAVVYYNFFLPHRHSCLHAMQTAATKISIPSIPFTLFPLLFSLSTIYCVYHIYFLFTPNVENVGCR